MILLGTLEGQRVTLLGGSPRIAAISSCFLGSSRRVQSETFLAFRRGSWSGAGSTDRSSRDDRNWARRIANVQGLARLLRDHANLALRFMAGLDSVGTVAIGMPEGQRSTVHCVQRARRSALGGHARRPLGYLLGNVLELAPGELPAIDKPLLIGIVVLTDAWVVYRDLSDRRSRHAAGAKIWPPAE